MKTKNLFPLTALFFLLFIPCLAEELPIPQYSNSVIISIEHSIFDSTEVDYIKNNFNFGLYAWLSFSKTHIDPVLSWQSDWSDASNGIQSFKNTIDDYIAAAKNKNVKLHIVLCSGLARGLSIYKEAKLEDIRNSQWYNDNNLAAVDPTLNLFDFNTTVYGTFSRYARKLRDNLEAKAKAALSFLKQKMDENPDTLIAVSGWGEAELNHLRTNYGQHQQDYFCDFSPFAVLEFRDWIRHEGMYNDSSGLYASQGYAAGGTRYQGSSGLSQFNSDYGTNFTSWDLKYFDWSLTDPYDTDPKDSVNNDPGIIPYPSYSHGNMMSLAAANVLAGGFDPPRKMGFPTDHPSHSDFWDLWNLFRETMVHNLILDMAKWADEAAIPADKWYSHQIPGDYLFGTNPQTQYKNPRYYASSSPLWTANILPYGSMGATVYDVKFYDSYYGDWWARTSQYLVPDIAQLSQNWAALEYDAEVYPEGLGIVPSSPEFIQAQYLRTYNYYCHLINFFRWMYFPEHNIKGTNKEIALKIFVEKIRDKARKTDLNFVFDPPKVKGISGFYVSTTGAVRIQASGAIQLEIDKNIWSGHSWEWKDWGDFDRFEVYRSTDPGFTADTAHLLGTTGDSLYTDNSVLYGNAYFYKVKAVNTSNVPGPASEEIMLLPTSNENVSILHVNKRELHFGAQVGSVSSPAEKVFIINLGPSGTTLKWQAASSDSWITINRTSGVGEAGIDIGVKTDALSAGIYQGQVNVSDPNAFNSPRVIDVYLTIYSSNQNEAPFGVFDTPQDGGTVSGSIPVTGWALDDIGINKVEIKRDPDYDDSPSAIGGDGLVYIGNAVFVKDSRPDVEAFYTDYPQGDRSGWGYMMLTYGLPRMGNGNFKLYAIAEDLTGKRTLLGTKQIICDNNSRTKPFGTIDTPGQGEVISGYYVNFGWALTPSPSTIARDSSTLRVSIDGVYIARPDYNHFRQDVYDSFPGYINRDGAIGFYWIDTTQYSNGVHNIGWYAWDNNGNADGFGSRFFEIQNLGGTTAGIEGLKSLKYREDLSGRLRIRIEEPKEIEVDQLGRIEMKLFGEGGHRFIGWGADETKGLPIGSTLDKKNGVFYWSIGPGFLKTHVLHFAVTDGYSRSKPVKVVVKIGPKRYDRTHGKKEEIKK